mmetsp:Transcript_14126/g.34386  ORF Transcript_14126/g.34386 Transcript_14126/m.34386 type:complete len:845 (-) Transcript_14126:87-2621(-)
MLHRPDAIPKLRIPREKNTYDSTIPPATSARLESGEGHWGITGKVTSTPRPETVDPDLPSKIPGYTGYQAGKEEGQITGRSIGFLIKVSDREVKERAHGSVSQVLEVMDRAMPMSARTRVEERMLQEKARKRAVDAGEKNLSYLRLATTTPRRRFKTQEEVEGEWRQRYSRLTGSGGLPPPTATDPDAPPSDAGPPPYGVPPLREQSDWRIAQEYLRQHHHANGAWEPAYDRMYTLADPSTGWTASGHYEIPKGWMAFGLRVPPELASNHRFWCSWHTTFYPCPAEHLPTVLQRLQLVIPGDELVDGTRTKIVYMGQKGATEKVDPNWSRPDRNCTRLYTTPSIRYAALKVNKLTRGHGYAQSAGKKLFFVIECKQKGGPLFHGGFHKCGETLGFEESNPRGAKISPFFENSEIEYYTLRKSSVVPYRVLVMTEELRLVETRTPGGGVRETPEKAWRQTKWQRINHPEYGARGTPGLGMPFREFLDKRSDAPIESGGTECPKPHVPYVSFPETKKIRDPVLDPMLRPSTQPVEPETLVLPSQGWRDGSLPERVKNHEAMRVKSFTAMRSEIREKFAALSSGSVGELFNRLAQHGGGSIQRGELERVLMRMNIIKKGNKGNFAELWSHLDRDNNGDCSIVEFQRVFGLLGKADESLELVRQKMATNFSNMQVAFRAADMDKDGAVSKEELAEMLVRFNVLDGISRDVYYQIWDVIDVDKSGKITYDEFVANFGDANQTVQTGYGPSTGVKVQLRKTYKPKGSEAATVNGMCEEGNACYAQKDYETAEKRYRAALRLDPNHIHSLLSLAWLLKTEKGDHNAARGLMKRATEKEPTNPFVIMQEALY